MTIDQEVARLLESASVGRINFACGPSRIWGDGYRRIATAIRRRPSTGHHVTVMQGNYLVQAAGCGIYNENAGNGANVLYLPFSTMRSVQDRAIALHEATHALQDWCRQPMLQADSECAAYIAQMMYAYLESGGFPYGAEDGLNLDVFEVFLLAYDVARRILTTPGAYAVTEQEQNNIKTALQRLPPYRDAARRTIHYNGI